MTTLGTGAETVTRQSQGVRHASALVSIIAVAGTPSAIWTRSNAARKVKIKKIMWNNRTALPGELQFGTGLAPLVQVIPSVDMLAGLGGTLTEADIPEHEFEANITVQADIASGAAPNDIQVKIEVEEF